jgi:Fe-S-cluster-containing dehydrogenase component
MYRRRDGIVDFDNTRCIGCKVCMQGCPYDAISIDPETETAAKCHYCTPYIELGTRADMGQYLSWEEAARPPLTSGLFIPV